MPTKLLNNSVSEDPYKNITHVIGIDEVGRGPLAGPVSVGAVCIPIDLDMSFIHEVKDSKQLSAYQREVWFEKIKDARDEGVLDYAVSSVNSKVIDKKGIVHAIKIAIRRSLKKLGIGHDECHVVLDGGLKAPQEYRNQETIIKGDEIEPVISLASIVAKVTRDAKMVTLSKKYKEYGFEFHKGYGTARHAEALDAYGLCPIHRKRYCSRWI